MNCRLDRQSPVGQGVPCCRRRIVIADFSRIRPGIAQTINTENIVQIKRMSRSYPVVPVGATAIFIILLILNEIVYHPLVSLVRVRPYYWSIHKGNHLISLRRL